MDVLGLGAGYLSISVAPINKLEITSKKIDVIQMGVGSKNNVHWTLSVAVIYISPKRTL